MQRSWKQLRRTSPLSKEKPAVKLKSSPIPASPRERQQISQSWGNRMLSLQSQSTIPAQMRLETR